MNKVKKNHSHNIKIKKNKKNLKFFFRVIFSAHHYNLIQRGPTTTTTSKTLAVKGAIYYCGWLIHVDCGSIYNLTTHIFTLYKLKQSRI